MSVADDLSYDLLYDYVSNEFTVSLSSVKL